MPDWGPGFAVVRELMPSASMESRVTGSSRRRAESLEDRVPPLSFPSQACPEWIHRVPQWCEFLDVWWAIIRLSELSPVPSRSKERSLRVFYLLPWVVFAAGVFGSWRKPMFWVQCPHLVPQAAFSLESWRCSFPLLFCVPHPGERPVGHAEEREGLGNPVQPGGKPWEYRLNPRVDLLSY